MVSCSSITSILNVHNHSEQEICNCITDPLIQDNLSQTLPMLERPLNTKKSIVLKANNVNRQSVSRCHHGVQM